MSQKTETQAQAPANAQEADILSALLEQTAAERRLLEEDFDSFLDEAFASSLDGRKATVEVGKYETALNARGKKTRKFIPRVEYSGSAPEICRDVVAATARAKAAGTLRPRNFMVPSADGTGGHRVKIEKD